MSVSSRRSFTAITTVLLLVLLPMSASASIAVHGGPLFDLDDFPLTTPPAGMGVLQGLAYMSLLLSVGLMWFRAFCVGEIDSRSARISLVMGIITFVLHIVLVPFIRVWEVGDSSAGIFDIENWKVSPWASSIRALAMLVIGLPLQQFFAQGDMSIAKNRRLLFLGGLIALGSLTVVGHTANLPPTILSHGSDFVHGMGAAFWFGGLIGLVLYLKRAFEERGEAGKAGAVLDRFSQLALLAVIGLAASGVVMSALVKSDPFDLTGTPFARVLIIKLLLVAIPILIAAYNRFKLMSHLEQGENDDAWARLRTAVTGEAVLLVAILAVTGFLVLQNPIS